MNHKMPICATVYAHEWGFIIPYKSGIEYQQQTGGVCCHHVTIEGAFIPLNYPGNLLDKLTEANYSGNDTKGIWKKIKEKMHFDFERIPAPEGQPYNQEGLVWIKLTKFESGWGHGDWVEKLVGMELCLIYPNSD
uniref:Uncharacterized protein n=1 Tax=viral metagenome TaxID=1070528 RepID=A0A6M3X5Y6_9ZZZZ